MNRTTTERGSARSGWPRPRASWPGSSVQPSRVGARSASAWQPEWGDWAASRTPRRSWPRGPRQAHVEGLDLHANDRARLERLCRYLRRSPLAQDRLRLRADGRVVVRLRQPWLAVATQTRVRIPEARRDVGQGGPSPAYLRPGLDRSRSIQCVVGAVESFCISGARFETAALWARGFNPVDLVGTKQRGTSGESGESVIAGPARVRITALSPPVDLDKP